MCKLRHILVTGTFLLVTFFSAHSQQSGEQAWFIRFTDKNNSVYSVDKPLEFLSPRAINRRDRNHVEITTQDFPVNSWYVDSLRAKGAKILFTSRWFNAATIMVDTDSIITNIVQLPFVKKTERVFKIKNPGIESCEINSVVANTSTVQFGNDEYGKSFRQIEINNGHYIHNVSGMGQGMVIAVIDAGFYKLDSLDAFNYLFDNNRILCTHDFVDGDSNVYHAHTHGTYVMGVMAGKIFGKLIGTAPEASYILLRSENADNEYLLEEDAWVAAAEYADSAGADIINTSLGYSVFNNPAMNHSYQDMNGNTTRISKGADIAASKGILVVSSAGNEGLDPWHYITAPADADSVLAVGAIDADLHYAPFSGVGPSSDGQVKPNVVAMGVATATVSMDNGFLSFLNGTSLSSPVMAGLCASLWSLSPDLPMMEIKKAVELSCPTFGRPNDSLGYGIPNLLVAMDLLYKKYVAPSGGIDIIQGYPNPFSDEGITLTIMSAYTTSATTMIIDCNGRLIFSKEIQLQEGEMYKLWLNPQVYLRPGIYKVVITNGKDKASKTIMRY